MTDISLRYLLYGEDRSATKTARGVAKEAESTASRVGGAFSKLGGAIGGEVGDVLDKVGEGLSNIGEHSKKMSAGLIVGGSALTGIGAAFQMIGSKDKQATDQLKAAIGAAGQSYDTYREDIEKTIKAQENHAHSAVDTQEALRVLVQATGSTQKATESMTLVANLAAAKHISLADAASLVAKVYGGSGTRTLREFGVELGTSKDKTANAEAALTSLGTKLSGQASASVDNFSGKVDVIKTKLEDWTATMGQKVGPALTAIGPVLAVAGSLMQVMATRNAAAAVAQDAESAATVRQTVAQTVAAGASKAWAAAQWLLNAALDANPIGIIVVAVAALVAAFVLAYQHSETFRNIVQGALKDVGDAATALWEDAIRPAFKFIIDLWFTVVGALVDGAASAFGWVPGIGGKLKSAAKKFDEFRDTVNSALSGVHDRTVTVSAMLKLQNEVTQNKAPGTTGTPKAFATGGLVTGGVSGRDSVPAILTPGEFVVTPDGSNLVVAGSRGGGGNMYIIQPGVLTRDGAREIDKILRQLAGETGGALGYG